MQPSKKFAFDIGITFIASAISIPMGFIISIFIGRYLGAGDLGLYYMNFTIYGIAMLFAGIGIPAAIIKYVAQYRADREKSNKYVSSGIITSLLLGIGFSILFYLSAGVFERIFDMPGLSTLEKILSFVFPFSLVNGTLLGLLNGMREMKKFALSTIIQSVLMMVISVLLLYLGYGVNGVVFGTVLSSIGSCIYLVFISRSYFEITFEDYIQTTKEILKFGVQIFATNAINVINYQADTIMIGYFLTAVDVGHYGVAANFSKFFWIIPNAISTITYPATSEYWGTRNHEALQMMIDKSMKYTALLLLPAGLGIGFFGEEIITLIYKEDFKYSVLPMLILIIGTVVFGIIKSIGGSVTAAGRPDLGMKVTGISAFINIVLNASLIPAYGIVGAAIATMISLLVNSLVGLFLTIKILDFKFDFEWFIKLFGITFLLILSFKYLAFINIYIIGFMILFIYMIIIFMFFIKKEDRDYFLQLLH
ncbi:Stage V sporulation protein B [Methanosarcinales archaeon]|nr:Stage V sporulation protein B [Methanosarcinales archaeon]